MKKCLFPFPVLLLLLQFQNTGAQLTVSLPHKEVTVENIHGNAIFTGVGCMGKPGKPNLPAYEITFLLPDGVSPEEVTVILEKPVVKEIEGTFFVKPSLPRSSRGESNWPAGLDVVDNKDMSVYGRNVFYPESFLGTVSFGKKRRYQLMSVTIYPYRYNPVSEKLKMLSGGTVTVRLPKGSYQTNTVKSAERRMPVRSAEKFILRNTVDPEVLDSYSADTPAQSGSAITTMESSSSLDASGGYLIITTEYIVNGSSELQNLVDCKEAEGFTVSVITEGTWGGGTTGDQRADNIRQWLVDNHEAYDAEYVLLIGNPDPDEGDVPMKMCWPRSAETEDREAPTDYYYAELSGNWDVDGDTLFGEDGDDFGTDSGPDIYADVAVGRIPFYDVFADLDKILAKSVSYSQAVSRGWRSTMLLPMEPSNETTPGYQLGERINEDYLQPNGWESYRIYDKKNDWNDQFIDEVLALSPAIESAPCTFDHVNSAWRNNPFGMVIWHAHGSPSETDDIIHNYDAGDLDDCHPSMTFQASCDNATPEITDNLAYSLLLNGAVTTIGATRVSWFDFGQSSFSNRGSNQGMGYTYGKYMVEEKLAAGDALNEVRANVIIWDISWMNHLVFNVYGCPDLALNIDDKAPRQLSAFAPATDRINLGWFDQSDDEEGFYIERSTDGTTFTRIATMDPNVTSYVNIGLSPETKYFYRIQMFNAEGVSDYSNVDSTTTFTNASPGAAATASSQLSWGDYGVENINDDNNDSRWVASDGTFPQWVFIDMGDVRPISGCEIIFPFDGSGGDCYDYIIETSDDNSVWTVRTDRGSNTITETVQSSYFESFSRYMRITFSDAPGTYRASVNELRIFGTVLPTQPFWKQTTNVPENQLELCWKPSANADSYTLMQARSPGGHRFVIARGLNVNTYLTDHLIGDKSYVFSIVGVNNAGQSSNVPGSNENVGNAEVTVPIPVSSVFVSANESFSGYTIFWSSYGIDNATGFEVERRIQGVSDWTLVASMPHTATQYIDLSAYEDVIYEYRVFAVNSGGRSQPSDIVATTVPPVRPVLSLNSYDPAAQTVQFSFYSIGEPAIDGYRIEKMADFSDWQEIADVPNDVNTHTDVGLQPNHFYQYRVIAYNQYGDSRFSFPLYLRTIPDAPTDLRAVITDATSIQLDWTDNSPCEEHFHIERAEGSGAFSEIAATPQDMTIYTDGGLTTGMVYHYRVRASNETDFSEYSNTITVTAGNIIFPAPSGLTASVVSGSEISLSWNDNSSGEDGFRIERSTNESGPFIPVGTTAENVTTFAGTGLEPDQTYWFRILAYSSSGNSPCSDPAQATTLNTIPAAPSELIVTSTSATTVSLQWTNNATNKTGYYIEQAPGSSGPWTVVVDHVFPFPSYTISNLAMNTTYWFRVCAYNDVGSSDYSNVVSGTTGNAPPDKPSNLTATPNGTNRIDLVWEENTSNENGFHIETGESSIGPWIQIADVTADVTTFSHNGLATGNTYWYRIRAFNAYGKSDYTNVSSATTGGLFLDAPQNLTATVNSSSQITLNWNEISMSENGFRIERRSSGGSFTEIGTVGPNTTTFTDNGLVAGVTYYYLVRAFNAISTSKYSNTATATTTGSSGPTAPSNLTATAVSSNQINLSWSDNSFNENGFTIERSFGSAGSWNQIATVGPGVTEYFSTGLSGGITYWYRVNAFNGSGGSDWSNYASATTPAGGYGNLALNATATASSAIAGTDYDAAKINDDNTATRWAASSGNFPEWVTLDLGNQHTVSEVEMMFAFEGFSGDCYDFTIQTSRDNVNWTTHVNQNPNWNTAQTQRYGLGTNARYVRITVTGAPGSYRASLYEFRVFGQ